MSVELRLPSITGVSEAEQLSQIKSYLYQFVPQLQWALSTLETSPPSATESTTQMQTVSQKTSLPASPEATFNSIKSLIIKSAEIVDSYYGEINTRLGEIYVSESNFSEYKESNNQTVSGLISEQEVLDSEFVRYQNEILGSLDGISDEVNEVRFGYQEFKSDFGEYTEKTSEYMVENDKQVGLIFNNVQSIETDIGMVKNDFYSTDARMFLGLLYYKDDGSPAYGLEIGQITEDGNGEEVFNAFARLTADKLSFYDKGTEVAWISNYTLNITHAKITGTLTLGKYVIDTSKGLALKWVEEGSD